MEMRLNRITLYAGIMLEHRINYKVNTILETRLRNENYHLLRTRLH